MDSSAFQNLLSRLLIDGQLSGVESEELGSMVVSHEFAAGEALLTEGKVNDRLYFLISGQVGVYRAGEKIAVISTPGNLLGEMGMITGKPSSASCIAETPLSVLVLEPRRFGVLSPRLQELLTNALNRLFAIILVEKLNTTNEKARLFEITNRELEKAKHALESSSRLRIDQLTWNQRSLLKKLNHLLTSEIDPVRHELASLGELPPGPLREVSTRVSRLTRELEQLKRAFEAERPLGDVRVLLAEDDIDEQIDAKMSLGGTGVDLTVVSSIEAGREALETGRFDVVCVNSHFVDLIAYALTKHPNTKFVFMTSEPISSHFQTLKQHPELSAILARHPDDRAFTVRNTATTIRKLTAQDVFGLDKYLGWGTDIREERVVSSTQRPELIAKMSDYFKGMGIRSTLIRRCERVAEELLMNSIYDAPIDDAGKPIYNHLTRDVEVTLQPKEQGYFRYACDGAFLALSCEDPFGALDRSTILNYLERCFGEVSGDATADAKGGGGNGLYQIIQSSSLVIFNVHPKTRTEVIAIFNINIQINKISVHPSFHYFEAT